MDDLLLHLNISSEEVSWAVESEPELFAFLEDFLVSRSTFSTKQHQVFGNADGKPEIQLGVHKLERTLQFLK